jgi:predicted RND superfamily exporter protein
MKMFLTNLGLRRPWLTVVFVLIVTALFASQLPKVTFDNDPENMLDENEYVRVFHHQVKEKFALYDFVIVGVVNESDQDGIFNVGTLGRIDKLTHQLLSLKRSDDGLPQVTRFDETGAPQGYQTIDLAPQGTWEKILAAAFNHNPNNLFEADGNSAIISNELIAPSVVDNIKQAEHGSLKLEYLMERPPTTQEEALTIRDDAMNNPLFAGTLVSEDGKALSIYIPTREKTYSYNIASLVQRLTTDWPASDQVLITGLPVAEDTFGIEMLTQMATSAPLAGLAIFLLLFLFFRNLPLIIAPMVVAVASVVCTMGLLIGLGFDVHIMSSMIAIFLMPIAVADSVHILSEFYDTYPRFQDKERTIRHVIGHLFQPMLFTTLTTIAGFASLSTTPIPPVQVFGLHVAFGVAVAWTLSMLLIPAYIMLFVPESQLATLGKTDSETPKSGPLNRWLEWLGRISYLHWKAILTTALLVFVISIYGITRIQVNDNPVKWFTESHQIRVADRILNAHFGGTYTAYLVLAAVRPDQCDCVETATIMTQAAEERFSITYPEATATFIAKLEELKKRYGNVTTSDTQRAFVELVETATELDAQTSQVWNLMADEIIYLDPAGLTLNRLSQIIAAMPEVSPAHQKALFDRLSADSELSGGALLDKALRISEEFAAVSFQDFVYKMEAELTAPLFKQPDMLRYIEQLQQHVQKNAEVGKTSSAVDALKKATFELKYLQPEKSASPAEVVAYEKRNNSFYAVPDSAAAVGQVFVQLEGMKKKDSLFHLVTRDYQQANIWFQLTSGDNKDMEAVVRDVKQFITNNPPPTALRAEWAGLTYINTVWQDRMVGGMIGSLIGSFVVVLLMMMLLFRSVLFGALAMIPLTLTITFIYGLIGLVGKDYDMPVAILSALTLGLSVDFAIHFLQRARAIQAETGSWREASSQMFKEPAMAISRNAIIIAIGFTPLLVAPLIPYKTVGFFLATIMAVSWLATLFILPAILTPLRKRAFSNEQDQPTSLTDKTGE